eukprot:GHUV01000840.1.p1 GENE.GHUV01000840.1~~GHUV01000840.1.p1  ORF type:complete len:142 (+),score=26.70 GHUV01000840.1:126-551(+)
MATMKLACAILASYALVSAVAASEDHSSVQVLGSDFDDKVNDGSVYFIKFFAPWCGHCKRLAPTWKELADAFKDDKSIKIAHVDCTQDRDVCTTADIKGYPTLKVYHKGEEVKAYRGARELEALKTFVQETADEVLRETTE